MKGEKARLDRRSFLSAAATAALAAPLVRAGNASANPRGKKIKIAIVGTGTTGTAGELVEEAATRDLFHKPLHPYTTGLLDSVPRLGETKGEVRLRAIQGRIPAMVERTSGCIFAPRCPLAIEICETRPPLFPSLKDNFARCHRWEEIAAGEVSSRQPSRTAAGSDRGSGENDQQRARHASIDVA